MIKCPHALIIACSNVYLLWWSQLVMLSFFSLETNTHTHTRERERCMLSWSHAHMSTRLDDHMIKCSHTWLIICSRTYMFTCLIDHMLPCSHVHRFGYSHVYTLGWWYVCMSRCLNDHEDGHSFAHVLW